MHPLLRIVLAVGSGLLFGLSLPPHNFELLAWFALAPAFLAARGLSALETVGLAIIAGASCAALLIGWPADLSYLLWAAVPFLWLILLMAAALLAARATSARSGVSGIRWVALVACTGVAAEWVTTFLPLPIDIALSQYRNLAVMQVSSIAGIWGVSLLLWWLNASLAVMLLRCRFSASAAISSLLIVTAALCFGEYRLAALHAHEITRVRVAAIQDISSEEIGSLMPESTSGQSGDADREQMTRAAVKQRAQLIVWSEECLGSAFAPENPADPTRGLARALHASLVVGYSDASRPKPYNGAALLSPGGDVLGVHHKNHLYLGEIQLVQAGNDANVASSPIGRVGMEICFDSCYTGLTRRLASRGARLIAMPNYDPPCPGGVLHELHGAIIPFRAVENDIAFVRADSNGLSQIIAPDGRVIAQGPLFHPATLIGSVPLGSGNGTLFTRFGDWLAYLCTTVAVTLTILLVREGRVTRADVVSQTK